MPTPKPVDYTVDLPAGGKLHLQTPDEVQLWNDAYKRYRADYVFTKINDLVTLGTLLQQHVIIFRAQTAINGMEPLVDQHGIPTGAYTRAKIDGQDLAAYQKTLVAATGEMRELEKALGIDKKTREQGGTHTLENYLRTLKRAAHDRGIHITKQVIEYQGVMKELGWRLRMLYTADSQDRAYHNITPKTVLDWLYGETQRLEDLDKEYARTTGKLYIGQL